MQRFIRRRNRPQPRRGPARWTALEIGMLVVAILLIVFPLYAEASRWLNPLPVPAAPRAQADATATTAPGPQRVPTDTPLGASPAPPTATTAPTATTGANPTATTVPPTATTGASPTATTAAPTATTGASPTATTAAPTATTGASPTSAPPTATPIPGTPTATLTPLPNQPPLQLVKSASAQSLQIGDRFNYTLSVFSNSLTNSSVTVRDEVPSQLDVLSATTSSGKCTISGTSISCTVTARNNQPATITIGVQVSNRASPGSRLFNQAAAQDDRQQTAASDQVGVNISSGTAPTSVPGGPTNTPTSPTNTPGGPTNTPTSPTNTPVNPTSTPKRGGGGGGSSGGGGGGGSSGGSGSSSAGGSSSGSQPLSTPQLPPLPEPGSVVTAPTPRTGRVPVPSGTRPSGGQTSGARATAVPTVPPTPVDNGPYFRMRSDWGSAFPNQSIVYEIEFRNTRADATLTNLRIVSDLPENVDVITATRRLDDQKPSDLLVGNHIDTSLDKLAAGQTVKITVGARIKQDVQVDSRLVSQAQATYDGLSAPLSSNVVTVLIVGSAFGPAVQGATVVPTATAGPTATAVPTTTPASTATSVPAATSAPAGGQASANANPAAAPLPATSSGVPIFGFALLGFTLLLRTVRLHRGQTRI